MKRWLKKALISARKRSIETPNTLIDVLDKTKFTHIATFRNGKLEYLYTPPKFTARDLQTLNNILRGEL